MIIRDSCGKFVDTMPYKIEDGVLVNVEPPVLHYLPKPKEDKPL
jgi:hypothetical protein